MSACAGETSGEYDSRVIASGVLADLVTLFHSRHESERQVSHPPMQAHIAGMRVFPFVPEDIYNFSGGTPMLSLVVPSMKSISCVWHKEAC
jgi:hypothetical protein